MRRRGLQLSARRPSRSITETVDRAAEGINRPGSRHRQEQVPCGWTSCRFFNAAKSPRTAAISRRSRFMAQAGVDHSETQQLVCHSARRIDVGNTIGRFDDVTHLFGGRSAGQ